MKRFSIVHSLPVLALLLSSNALLAQKFTRADSLRGGLRPERTQYDVNYYHLIVDIDPGNKYLKGSVEIHMTALSEVEQARIQMDLFKNMSVDRIYKSNGTELSFRREENAIWIDLASGVSRGEAINFNIDYSGNPLAAKRAPWDGGFDWKRDRNGNPWVGVAVEGTGASLWWPNKDHLYDEPDSMRISLIVPEGLVGVSNGHLESEELLGPKHRFNWKVSYPINNYNVTAYVGKYLSFEDKFEGSEGTYKLRYYVLDYNLEKAKTQFAQVKPMLECYEKYLGPYPYPKDGFALVESPYLGMEHQSAIAYGNQYKNGYLGMDQSGLNLPFDYIIIHETGHEYWGNSVSMSDLADMWIHEGFCTYSEALYVECMWGAETALKYSNWWKRAVRNDEPIIGHYDVNHEGSGDMYYKGALMLHTLRYQIANDSLWFACIRSIQTNFRNKNTNSNELIAYINQKLGNDFSPLFDAYLKQSKPPVLVYTLKRKGKGVQVRAKWTGVPPQFKLNIGVMNKGDLADKWMINTEFQTYILPNTKLEDFSFDESKAYFLVEKQK